MLQGLHGVLYFAENVVAVRAKQTPYFTCGVVVIYMPVLSARRVSLASRTLVILLRKHLIVALSCQAVHTTNLPIAVFTPSSLRIGSS